MSQGPSFSELVDAVHRQSAKDLPPAIPSDKPSDGSTSKKTISSSPIKPKRPLFERYETYISCPGCGSLVPKGTKTCDCGYDLSGPFTRIARSFRRVAPILICILLVAVGTVIGYYAGQESMHSDLEEQYSLGYESGQTAGYKTGYEKGLHSGIEESRESFESSRSNYYTSGYRDAMSDAKISRIYNSPPTVFYSYFPEKDELHSSLASEYGFSTIPKPRLSFDKLVPTK